MTQQQTTTQPAISGPANIAGIVNELWERCADRLTTEELGWFTYAAEYASLHMQNLEGVIDGIGCLVGSDTSDEGRVATGYFQSAANASALLFFLADSVRHARALATVRASADHRLRYPDQYRRAGWAA